MSSVTGMCCCLLEIISRTRATSRLFRLLASRNSPVPTLRSMRRRSQTFSSAKEPLIFYLSSETEKRWGRKGIVIWDRKVVSIVSFEADATVYWHRIFSLLLSPETENIVIWGRKACCKALRINRLPRDNFLNMLFRNLKTITRKYARRFLAVVFFVREWIQKQIRRNRPLNSYSLQT